MAFRNFERWSVPFSTFHSIFETSRVEWRNSTAPFVLLPKQKIIIFVRIKLITVAFTYNRHNGHNITHRQNNIYPPTLLPHTRVSTSSGRNSEPSWLSSVTITKPRRNAKNCVSTDLFSKNSAYRSTNSWKINKITNE